MSLAQSRRGRPRRASLPYFSARLKAKLREAQAMRGLLIEAPPGYGKTTVVQEFLLKALPEEINRAWHHSMDESPQAAWRGFCLALSKIDAKTGTALLRLGLPDEDTAGDAGRLLRDLKCAAPTWLVLDDFHHLAGLAPVFVWKHLLDHDCPHLCVVLVARPLAESLMPCEKSGFLRLGAEDLRLTEQESREYAAKAGLTLSGEEAEELHRRAEGWMFPLTLHLRHYRETKTFAPASDFDGLIKDGFWNKLDDAGRDFLLWLSPVDHFSLAQASFFLEHGGRALPAKAVAALGQNSLIRFDAASNLYYPHSLLLEFIRARFAELPESDRRARLYAAGDWCAANGERKKAIALYYRLRDFEKILALDLSGLPDNHLLDLPDTAYAEALKDIAAHCGREMKARHPLSMIQLAFEFFGQGCPEEYAALGAEMAEVVETGVPGGERDYLRGELLLLEAFSRYNDIAEMGRRMKRASELTGGQTSLVRPDNSWTLGNASVLFMYHREAGRLDAELSDIERYGPIYTAMAGGHGSGGPALMRAEVLLGRGELETAEIFGHRARYEAALRDQVSLRLGAELFFGRLAILRGNAAAFSDALGSMASLAKENPQKSNRGEADLARSFLASLLRRPQDAAGWLRQGPPEAFNRRLFTQAIPFAHICRAHCLLLDGRPEVVLGESAAVLGLASALHYTLALIYGHIHIAAAWAGRGEAFEAASALRRALDLAWPDKLLLPFAENHALIKEPLAALLSGLAPEVPASVLALAEQLKAGRRAIVDKLYSAKGRFGLTRREAEVAGLAVEGQAYEEIARRLNISLNTAKTHLKSAYRKTGTSSPLALKKILES